MPNGIESLQDAEFEHRILEFKDDPIALTKFAARQTYDQRKDMAELKEKMKDICKKTELTDKRSLINRYVLIGLILFLILVGVVNPEMLSLLRM